MQKAPLKRSTTTRPLGFNLALGLVAKSAQGAPMPIKHPATGEPIITEAGPATLLVAGADSPAFQAAFAQVRARNEAYYAQNKVETLPVEMQLENRITLTTSVILGWENCNMQGDSTFDSTRMAQLLRGDPWLLSQVEDVIWDRSRFLTDSMTS